MSKLIGAGIALAIAFAGAACNGNGTPEDAPDYEVAPNRRAHGANDEATTATPGPEGDPATPSVPTCVDVKSDAHNCGRCGHDCEGGACSEGVCQAVELAKNIAIPQGAAVAADALYVTAYEGGAVLRLDKTSPGTPIVVTQATSSPSAIGVEVDAKGNAVRVIWGEEQGSSSNVKVCSVPTCTSATAVPTGADVHRIVVRGDTAYWTQSSTVAGGKVRKCTIADCPGTAADVVANEPNAYGLALAPGDGALFVDPVGIAVDATHRYIAGAGSAGISSCALASCDSATPFGAATNPHDIASDDVDVYWTNGLATGGSVVSCPKAGCNGGVPRVVAPDQKNPYTIALDEHAIYWTSSVPGGSVMKIAKP